MNLHQHLKERHFNIDNYPLLWDNEEESKITFPLWTLAGQLVGYQQYSPLEPKKLVTGRDLRLHKYYTYVSKQYRGDSYPTAWGLEVLDKSNRVIYITEGIFKSCRFHNYKINSLAVLGNNPLHLKSWLLTLGYHLIAVCDGDKAGKELAYIAHEAIYFPDGIYLDEMSEEDFERFLICIK